MTDTTAAAATLTLPDGEPQAGPWTAVPVAELAGLLLEGSDDVRGRPWVIAIDGRSGAGKSTLVERLLPHVGPGAVVHIDDISWNEPMYEWGHLLAEHVLEPLHRGEAVGFRPPAWAEHGRDGALEIPAGLRCVLVEGTGANQRELAHLIDRTVWIQADHQLAEHRGIARDIDQGVNGDTEESRRFWHWWMSHELPFFARERPGERADGVVCGTPSAVGVEVGQAEDDVVWAAGPLGGAVAGTEAE